MVEASGRAATAANTPVAHVEPEAEWIGFVPARRRGRALGRAKKKGMAPIELTCRRTAIGWGEKVRSMHSKRPCSSPSCRRFEFRGRRRRKSSAASSPRHRSTVSTDDRRPPC